MNNPFFRFQIEITGFISNIYDQTTPVQNGKYIRRHYSLWTKTKTSPRWVDVYVTGEPGDARWKALKENRIIKFSTDNVVIRPSEKKEGGFIIVYLFISDIYFNGIYKSDRSQVEKQEQNLSHASSKKEELQEKNKFEDDDNYDILKELEGDVGIPTITFNDEDLGLGG